ncbi:YGGT family protein [Raphanus sativus]|uniref:YlmG homolog protein 1-2, chloroplastic n=1 Tax=Raphanus sativus TaxID=3726 RepID=A0A6J0KJF6_RAPSA|nr:ylmG homolog protein 1-2, chloroplastic [Raphanus sativus]KAJ4881564.1 YGGT family protein [Raphanus sativus]
MALFSTTNNILSLRSSILMNPRFLPINHHCNPPLRLSVPHKPTFNLSHRNPKTIVSAAVTLSTDPSPRFPFSDSTKSITTLAILAGIVTKSLIHKLSAAFVTLSPQFQASLRISGPLFFAAVRDRPAGYLNTPLTVVAAGLSKWLDIYSGVLMVRVLLSWFPNIPWDRQPLSAIRDLCDPYLNLFRNIIPPVFDTLDVSPLLAFAVLGTLGSILNNSR